MAFRSIDSASFQLSRLPIQGYRLTKKILNERLLQLFTAFKAIVQKKVNEAAAGHIGIDKTPIHHEDHLGVTVAFFTDSKVQHLLIAFRRYQYEEEIHVLEHEKLLREVELVLAEYGQYSIVVGGFKNLQTMHQIFPITGSTAPPRTLEAMYRQP